MRWNDSVQTGMLVTGTNGEKLGKVIRCDQETFVVEKGMFFPKDYELRYDYITDVEGNDITYELAEAEHQPGTARSERSARTAEVSKPTAAAAAPAVGGAAAAEPAGSARAAEPSKPIAPAPSTPVRGAAAAERPRAAEPARAAEPRKPLAPASAPASEEPARLGDSDAEGSRIALMDEELDIEKVPRETGHVRVKKIVRTEEKHVTVPVRREDVVIERVPISRDAAALSSDEGGATEPRFQEETIDIPLHEEELRVTKRPVVREEVVVRTVLQAGEKEAVATLRHEDAEFEDTRIPAQRRPEARESSAEPLGYASPGSRR